MRRTRHAQSFLRVGDLVRTRHETHFVWIGPDDHFLGIACGAVGVVIECPTAELPRNLWKVCFMKEGAGSTRGGWDVSELLEKVPVKQRKNIP